MGCNTVQLMKTTQFLRKIGQNIKEARIKAGMRQIDVNEKTGLTYRHYQNIEAGRINLTVATLCKLSKVFNVPIHELLEDC